MPKTSFSLTAEAKDALEWLRSQPGGFDLSNYINQQITLLATKRGWGREGMMKRQTLREFLLEHDLSPEDGGLGLEWFRPDEMLLIEERCIPENGPVGDSRMAPFYLFSDDPTDTARRFNGTRCGLIDSVGGSLLLTENELVDAVPKSRKR